MEHNTNLKNRRISPKGIIDLPFVVRKALGFIKGRKQLLMVEVVEESVRISPAKESGPSTYPASPRGLIKLPEVARQALSAKGKGRYGITAADNRDFYEMSNKGEKDEIGEIYLF